MSKKCKVCKTAFTPTQPFQTWCCPDHGFLIAAGKLDKIKKAAQVKERKADAVKREKLKSKAQWAREAQTAFNAFIRERDADLPCISCGRHHGGQYHAGHYLSVGARPELRFNAANVNKQCAPCNTHLSGNAVMYRANLIKKVGLEVVEFLEGYHELRKDTIEDLKHLKSVYQTKTKQLKESRNEVS
jgi:hypothetical protein